MTTKKKWKVGILGLGHWYSAYGLARSLPEYPGAELVAVAAADSPHLDQFAQTFGVPSYDDPAALLERRDIDIVQISARVSEVPGLTLRAARAGKHIILGKPMAMTLAQADEMVEVVREAGVTCVPFQAIMRLRLLDLKERIARGDIGEIAVMHQTGRWSIAEDWPGSGTPGWFVDPEHVPGGALIDEGIYWMDVLRWFAGSEVIRVEAKTANLVHKELRVEDWGMAMLEFANGIRATVEGSWTINAPRKTGPSPKHNSVVRLEVVGTRGEVIEQFFRDPGRAVLAAGASDWVFERKARDLFQSDIPMPLGHLIDCLEQGHSPIADIMEARQSFAVALAAYQAARESRSVSLVGPVSGP